MYYGESLKNKQANIRQIRDNFEKTRACFLL